MEEDEQPVKQTDEEPGIAIQDGPDAMATEVTNGNAKEQKVLETEDSPAREAPVINIIACGVCEKAEPKYKCPRCYLPYCSVACNKIHRENHPPDPEPAPQPTEPANIEGPPPADAELGLRGKKFKHPWRTLQHSEELQWLFRKYPRLPELLLDIHAATEAPQTQQSRIPASLLKDLPNQNQNNGWTRDKGIARGKEALRKARKADGEDGEAIREYSELVLHLMEDSRSRKDG